MKAIKEFGKFELKQRDGFNVEVVDAKALETSGVAFVGSGISVGDEITFPGTEEEVRAFKVNVRRHKFDGPQAFTVEVMKNGKVAGLSVGSLRRVDKDFKALPGFSENLLKNYDTDYARIKSLLGKTIVCTATQQVEVPIFDDNTGRPSGKFKTADFPVINFAEPKKNAILFA